MPRPVALPLIAVALSTMALSGCGSGSAHDITKDYINNEKLERAIERSVRAQKHRDVSVSCPAFVKVKPGGAFQCTAATRRGAVAFRVTMKDAKGNVHYEAVPR